MRTTRLPKVLLALTAAYFLTSLGHYAVAPMELHPLMANVTILSEVVAAALLLPVALWLLVSHVLCHQVGEPRS